MARIHKAALLKTPGAKLVAVYDVDEAKSRELAADAGAQICGSADELVSATDVHVVYVLTRQDAHHQNVLLALEAGKHVVVEKPVDITLAAIDRLAEVQARTKKKVTVISQHRFDRAKDALSVKWPEL